MTGAHEATRATIRKGVRCIKVLQYLLIFRANARRSEPGREAIVEVHCLRRDTVSGVSPSLAVPMSSLASKLHPRGSGGSGFLGGNFRIFNSPTTRSLSVGRDGHDYVVSMLTK